MVTSAIRLSGRKVLTVIGVAVLPARMILPHDLVDLAVDRLVEMLGREEVGDAIERLVVDEDGAEQRLLGLDVVRREPERFWFVAAAQRLNVCFCHIDGPR